MNDVSLNISDEEISGVAWTEVVASDGTTKYWYLWTGGNGPHNNGKNVYNFPLNAGSATMFQASFTGQLSNDYEFVSFFSSDSGEITGAINANHDLIDVTNQQNQFGDYYWGVFVRPRGQTGPTFLCDPVISNRRISPAKGSSSQEP